MTNRRLLRPAAAVSAAVLALTLAACGGGEKTAEAPATQTSAATDQQTGSAETSGSTESSAPADSTSEDGPAAAAARTAEGELAGSRAIELDIDGDGDDEIEVVVTDGTTAREVDVAADGSSVVRSEEEDLDADDKREIEAATVSMADAVTAARAEKPGTVSEVKLDEENGKIVWVVEIDGTDVHVDAATGDVVAS